jgi:DNA polymerase III alpha subunit
MTKHRAIEIVHRVQCADLGKHEGCLIEIVGSVSKLRIRKTTSGREIIFFVLTDSTGRMAAVWFPPRPGLDARERFVRSGRPLVVRGFNQIESEDTFTLIVQAAEFAPD